MATAMQQPKPKEDHKGNEPFGKAKDAGVHAVESAKDAVASVGEMAGEAVAAIGKQADDLTSGAGSDISKWGDALSHKGPQSGLVGHASQAVADTLKGSGHYLEEAKLSGMADDCSKLIQRHPLPAVLIGLGVGFILGRAMRS